MNKRKTIFLDRDGVINIDKHYLHKIEDFEFTHNLFMTCKYLQSLGYQLIIITNQSGIGREYFTEKDFKKLSDWMINELKKNHINILDLFYCPHKPEDKCECRKPKPGMIKQACKKYKIDLKSSWMIGDKISDMEAAYNAGINNRILISSEYTDKNKDLKTKNIITTIEETINIIKE
ncbi:D-glycero-beta-D-manno-heptose 1,7-bisphosphate 7-phosphatase [Arcobacter sp. YIC-464]|uniref:D-glycero-beta-D-manno-heptose 1,7-bisphosphate 7-phosphatase n=1 Tax=Arcobacter sp. YIC-464 TaxID=3376631 RepID=UPI003C22D284